MEDTTEEQFDLAPNIDEPMNEFKVVHLYNKSKKYHLTRQVLLDSVLTQNTYCFFYHILAKNIDEFNKMYGSFACLFDRSRYEADLYLNVDSEALEHIVKYIQTSKIDGISIYASNWKIIDEIIDLATMFGMPILVSMLRSLHPSQEKIDKTITYLQDLITNMMVIYKNYVDPNYDFDKNYHTVKTFIGENNQLIVDTVIKNNIYNVSLNHKWVDLLTNILIHPLVRKYLPCVETDDDGDEEQIKDIHDFAMDDDDINENDEEDAESVRSLISSDTINFIRERLINAGFMDGSRSEEDNDDDSIHDSIHNNIKL